jgi:hypothetical protein
LSHLLNAVCFEVTEAKKAVNMETCGFLFFNLLFASALPISTNLLPLPKATKKEEVQALLHFW